jgi:hypothetical protein
MKIACNLTSETNYCIEMDKETRKWNFKILTRIAEAWGSYPEQKK